MATLSAGRFGNPSRSVLATILLVAALFVSCVLHSAPAVASPTFDNVYYVNDHLNNAFFVTDCTSPTNIDCTFTQAIGAFNGDSTAGHHDEIVFESADHTFYTGAGVNGDPRNTVNNSSASLTIHGNGASQTVIDGPGSIGILTVQSGVNLTIEDLTMKNGNAAGSGWDGAGGAILFYGATLTINNAAFTDNSSAGWGGAINLNAGTMTISNSTFSGNQAGIAGGAIFVNQGPIATVANSTFSVNSATSYGGAISNQGTITVTASTFASNSSANSSTGQDIANGSIANVAASILAHTTGPSCTGIITDLGYNIDSDGTCGLSATGSISSSAALTDSLGPLQNNGGPTLTIMPDATSPALFAIPNGTSVNGTPLCPTTDQTGNASQSQGRCTIGALQPAMQSALTVSNATLTGSAGTPITLTSSGGSGTLAVTYSVSGSGCSITNTDQLSATGTDTCSVTAENPQNGMYEAITSVPAVFVFALAGQAALAVSNTTLTGTAGTPITLTSSGGSGTMAVAFFVVGPGNCGFGAHRGSINLRPLACAAPSIPGCSINGNQLLATQVHPCDVIAYNPANGIYGDAFSPTVAFTFSAAAQAPLNISNALRNLTVGTPATLSTSGGSGLGQVSFSVSGAGCSLNANHLSASMPTACRITATKAANGIYGAATSSTVAFTFAAGLPTVSIRFASNSSALTSASKQKLSTLVAALKHLHLSSLAVTTSVGRSDHGKHLGTLNGKRASVVAAYLKQLLSKIKLHHISIVVHRSSVASGPAGSATISSH